MNAKITEKKHNQLEMHAKLGKYKKNDIERILRKLIFDGFLKEDVQILSHTDTVVTYMKLGPKASLLINAATSKSFNSVPSIKIDIREETQVTAKTSKKYGKAAAAALDFEEDFDDDTDNSQAESNAEIRFVFLFFFLVSQRYNKIFPYEFKCLIC
jgi:hypothetical protein